ncbi:MAG: aminotransferase class I/II-fold pyridoxal phosphate-dependent enzyme, partial [Acutalibacteraceae bacterium]
AFYVFPNIGAFGLSSEEFCTRLIDEENVALVPGSAFGESGEGFARVSYAYSVRHIEKALERIGRFVQRLR